MSASKVAVRTDRNVSMMKDISVVAGDVECCLLPTLWSSVTKQANGENPP
jgi:hypothetical protein